MAIIVVISHFILLFSPVTFLGSFELSDFRTNSHSFNILLATTPLSIFMNGNWAVCIFFILSGYVLSLAYFKTNNPRVLQTSAFKRYLRLTIPTLAICIIIYVLHSSGIFAGVYYPRHNSEFSFGKALFANKTPLLQTLKIALFDVPLNGNTAILSVLWTLQIEFTGALLLFSFLLITHQTSKKWVWYALTVLFLFMAGYNYLILLFAGSFIAFYEEKIKIILKNNILKIMLLLAALFLGGIPNIEDRAKSYTLYSFTCGAPNTIVLYFHILSCILLFTYVVSSRSSKKILSIKPFLLLGKISFSLYLLHLPVLFILGSNLLKFTGGSMNYYFLFLICLLVCLALSAIFYRLVDATSVKLSNKIAGLFLLPSVSAKS